MTGKLCIIGYIDVAYATNWRLLKALDGINTSYVVQTMPYKITVEAFWSAYKFFKVNKSDCNVIWIASYSHQIFLFIYFARFLVWPLKPPPLIYDCLISIYDTRVFDRGWITRWNPKAFYYYFLDWFSCKVSKAIVVDTYAHGKYFEHMFGCRHEKIHRIFAGANRDIFDVKKYVHTNQDDQLVVSYHGKIIPGMSGTEYIVEAASQLKHEPIMFRMIGKGSLVNQFEERIEKEQLKNIVFTSWIPKDKLPKLIAEADIVCGALGTTPKAKKAIPLKVFEGIAMSRPVLVGDSPAARELFEEGVNCLFVKMGDADDLAQKIMLLKNNAELRERLGANAYNLYNTVLGHKAIGSELQKVLQYVS